MVAAKPPKVGTDPSPRELQALWLIAHGLTRDAVAARLKLSPDTVKSQLRRAARRLESRDSAHSIAICFRRGHFPPRQQPVVPAAELWDGHGTAQKYARLRSATMRVDREQRGV